MKIDLTATIKYVNSVKAHDCKQVHKVDTRTLVTNKFFGYKQVEHSVTQIKISLEDCRYLI